jgi:hypothetical protein
VRFNVQEYATERAFMENVRAPQPTEEELRDEAEFRRRLSTMRDIAQEQEELQQAIRRQEQLELERIDREQFEIQQQFDLEREQRRRRRVLRLEQEVAQAELQRQAEIRERERQHRRAIRRAEREQRRREREYEEYVEALAAEREREERREQRRREREYETQLRLREIEAERQQREREIVEAIRQTEAYLRRRIPVISEMAREYDEAVARARVVMERYNYLEQVFEDPVNEMPNVPDRILISDEFYESVLNDPNPYIHPIEYHGRSITNNKKKFKDHYRITDRALALRDRIQRYEEESVVGEPNIDRLWSALWARTLHAAFSTYFNRRRPAPGRGVGWGRVLFAVNEVDARGDPTSRLEARQIHYIHDSNRSNVRNLAHAIYELKYPTVSGAYTAFGEISRGGSDNQINIADANFTMDDNVEIFTIKNVGGEPLKDKLPYDDVLVFAPDAKNRELDGYCLPFVYLSITDACLDDPSMLLTNNKFFKLTSDPKLVARRSRNLIEKVRKQAKGVAVGEINMLLKALELTKSDEGFSYDQLGLNGRPLWDLFEEYLNITVAIIDDKGSILHHPTPGRPLSKSCAAICYTTRGGKGHYRLVLQLQGQHGGKIDEVHNGLVYYEKVAEIIAGPKTSSESKTPTETESKPKKKEKVKDERPFRYIFYDIETVSVEGESKVYSCCAVMAESLDKRPKSLSDLNETNSYFGRTLDGLLEWLMGPQCEPYRLVIVAFNGSKFDHIFFVKYLAQREMIIPTSTLLVHNSIYSLKTTNGWKLFDLARFLLGSLDSCCKNFKTECKKVEGFEHSIPQAASDKGELEQWVEENKDKLYEYNMMDCMSLCELTFKAEAAFKSVSNLLLGSEHSIFDHTTMASFSYKILTKLIKAKRPHDSNKIKAAKARVTRARKNLPSLASRSKWENDQYVKSTPQYAKLLEEQATLDKLYEENNNYPEQLSVPPHTHDDYKFFRSSIVAGRTQNMSGGPVKISDKLVMIDICSSYPYEMNTKNFPSGEYKDTEYERVGHLGVYECEFDQSILKNKGLPAIIPRRTEGQALDWAFYGAQKCTLTSADIASLREYGVEVKVGKGYYWERATSVQFHDYIEPLFRRKQFLDAHKNDEQGNDAEREAVKLMMNSVSGKVGQRLFAFTVNELSPSVAHSSHLLSQLKPESVWFGEEIPNALFIHGEVKEELRDELYKDNHKNVAPTITAAFIYSYARSNLYRALKYNGLYCDTDSVIMRYEDYQRFTHDYPHLQAGKVKELGQWEMETKQDGTDSYTFYGILPKQYALIPGITTQTPFLKLKLKGVSKNDILIPKDKLEAVKAMNNEERAAWAAKNKCRSFKHYIAARQAFDAQVENNKTYWLCAQVRRVAGRSFSANFTYMVKVVSPLARSPEVAPKEPSVPKESPVPLMDLVATINPDPLPMMERSYIFNRQFPQLYLRDTYIENLKEFDPEMPTLSQLMEPRNVSEKTLWDNVDQLSPEKDVRNLRINASHKVFELSDQYFTTLTPEEAKVVEEATWGLHCAGINLVADIIPHTSGDLKRELLTFYHSLPKREPADRDADIVEATDKIHDMSDKSEDIEALIDQWERVMLKLTRRIWLTFANVEAEVEEGIRVKVEDLGGGFIMTK